jgi:hypothetical protein
MSDHIYELEKLFEIWDNKAGLHLEVGPDRDGLGLIEIRSFDDKNKIDARLSFDKAQARLIGIAINELLGEHIAKDSQ